MKLKVLFILLLVFVTTACGGQAAPAEEVIVEEAPTEEAIVEEAPTEETIAEEVMIEDAVVEETPAIEATVEEEAPVEEEVPVEEMVEIPVTPNADNYVLNGEAIDLVDVHDLLDREKLIFVGALETIVSSPSGYGRRYYLSSQDDSWMMQDVFGNFHLIEALPGQYVVLLLGKPWEEDGSYFFVTYTVFQDKEHTQVVAEYETLLLVEVRGGDYSDDIHFEKDISNMNTFSQPQGDN